MTRKEEARRKGRESLRFILIMLSTLWSSGFAGSIRGPTPKVTIGRELRPLQVLSAGQEFRITCPVGEGESASGTVNWFKDGELVTNSWSRFRITAKALRIRTLMPRDTGVYECRGGNGLGSQIARTRLLVTDDSSSFSENSEIRITGDSLANFPHVAPTFTSDTLEQAGPVHLTAGNTIRFRCEVQGAPPAKLTWVKDGKPVNDRMWRWSSWTLILNKLTAEDSGTYTCKAANSFGRAEINIHLHVTEMIEKRKPELALGYPNNTTVLAGHEAVMECVVKSGRSSIPPHIKWLKRVPQDLKIKNEHLLKYKHRLLHVENQHVLVIQESEDDTIRVNETQRNGTIISRLIFSKAEPGQHDGVYICLATNSVGYIFKDAKLTVLAGADILDSSASLLPFPVIVFGMSTAVSVLVIGAACALRRHQKAQLTKNHPQQQQQTRSLSPRKLSTPSINSSSVASFHRHSNGNYNANNPNSSSHQHHHLLHNNHLNHHLHQSNQNQLGFESRFLPSLHSASLADMMMICHEKCGISSSQSQQPTTMEFAMSRCSCCGGGDQSSEVSAARTYEQCFNESFITSSSHSHHSIHCGGHWT